VTGKDPGWVTTNHNLLLHATYVFKAETLVMTLHA
jgi:hypothetical protein